MRDIVWRMLITTASKPHKALGSTAVQGTTEFLHKLSIV
jgi:hypothetical protein